MLSDKFFNYLSGHITFKATGLMQEELLKECLSERIPLKNIKLTELTITAKASAKNYKKISRIAKGLGMKTKITERYGFDFWLFSHRKRYGIILGAILFFMVFSFLSSRLWSIDIKGAEIIPEEIILQKLNEHGIHIGMKIKNPDGLEVINLERTLLCEIPDAACIILNFSGTNLEVLLNEIHHKPYIIDDEKRKYNIIATETGQISEIKVCDGVAVVEKGQTVEKGQLLISGVIDGKRGKLHFKNASGEIKAVVEETIEIEIDLLQNDLVRSSEPISVSFIKIGNKKISLSFKKIPDLPYTHKEQSKKLLFFNIPMPIAIGADFYFPLTEKEIRLTREEAKSICLKDLENEEINRFRNNRIIDRKIVSRTNKNSYHIICNYLVEKDIGEKQEYFVEKPEEN